MTSRLHRNKCSLIMHGSKQHFALAKQPGRQFFPSPYFSAGFSNPPISCKHRESVVSVQPMTSIDRIEKITITPTENRSYRIHELSPKKLTRNA
jgi:hypothetical protein